MSAIAADLPYRLAWRASTVRAGAHRSRIAGTGGMFRDLTTLTDARDPRRIDLRQSLRDPFETIHVRRFEQTSAITVTVVADVSGSMSFAGRTQKFDLMRELVSAFATAVIRTGDRFALLAADDALRTDVSVPPTRSRSRAAEAIAKLAELQPRRAGSAGIASAAENVGTQRGLVILISDFLMPLQHLDAIFARLQRHDVIPIALHDSAEVESLPEWGLMELADLETGRRRLIALRPSLKAAWRRRIEARRSDFKALSRRYGHEPFEVQDRIDWHRLGAHLMPGGR